MFSWSRSRGPHYSLEDARLVTDSALSLVEKKTGERIVRTRTGIITESRLNKEVSREMQERTEQFTPDLLAGELGILDKDAVTAIIDSSNALQVSGVVYPNRQLVLLQDKIKQAVAIKPLLASDLCRQLSITLAVLNRIVALENDLTFVGGGNYVAQKSDFERDLQQFIDRVSKSEGPIKLSEIEQNQIKRQLFIDEGMARSLLPGTVDQNSDTFIPRTWVDDRREHMQKLLIEKGYLQEKELQANEIRDITKFARKTDSVIKDGWVVRKAYISSEQAMVKSALADRGYYDLRDLQLPVVKSYLEEVIDVAKYGQGFGSYLVKPSLESSLAKYVAEELSSTAQSHIDSLKITTGANEREIIAKLPTPTLTQIQESLEPKIEEADLAKLLANKISNVVRAQYLQVSKELIQKKLEALQHDTDLKISVYLQGVLSCPAGSTSALVYQEWEQYVTGILGTSPGSLENARARFLIEDIDALKTTASKLVDNIGQKLRAINISGVKDAAPVLHLAIMIWHARKISNKTGGILRISGKLVPKVLKAFPDGSFPAEFSELRKDIREPSLELVSRVKNIALDALN